MSDVQVIDGGPPRPAEPDDQLGYRGFVVFDDPDGNGWAIQQLSQPLAERTAALAAADQPRGGARPRLMGSAALAVTLAIPSPPPLTAYGAQGGQKPLQGFSEWS